MNVRVSKTVPAPVVIDATYGHLAPDAEEQERVLLDLYDSRASAAGR